MKFSDLAEQFSGKRRSINDLARYIQNRTDDHSNYCLLLGAGCSVTSGIRSASALTQEWRKQACAELGMGSVESVIEQIDFLRKNGSTWYDSSREYSSLFERRFDLQRQRRVFVESEVAGKTPSIGYAYLTSLVENKYFNTIFTTNFDDLINEAFYLFSDERPIICAHDSSINSVTVTSKRPKVIKLHGDYLFDDLKSTLRETESLEQNMKAKLAEFSKDHGLIVLGYSGADRSIMDNLQTLLRNDEFLKSGIYWCLRKDSEVSEELRKLLFRDRSYYVEVEGFDEFFAELYSIFNPGQYVPEAALGINRRSGEALQRLLLSHSGVPSTTEVLKKARIRLEKHTKRSAIAHLIAKDDEDDKASFAGTDLTDDELLLLSSVSDLITSEQHDLALKKVKDELTKPQRPKTKLRLMEQCINAHMGKNDRASAIAVADEIIQLFPKRSSSYMKKSRLLNLQSEKLAEINQAINIDPFAVGPRLALLDAKLLAAKSNFGENRQKLLEEAYFEGKKAVELNPSTSNMAWFKLFEVIEFKEKEIKKYDELTSEIIENLKKQNPYSTCTLELRYKSYLNKSLEHKNKAFEELLQDIRIAEERYSDDYKDFSRLRLLALKELGDIKPIEQEIDRLKEYLNKDPELASLIATILRSTIGDDERAIKILRESLKSSQFSGEVLTQLVEALCDVGKIDDALTLIDKWGNRLNRKRQYQTRLMILDSKNNYSECLKEIKSYEKDTGIDMIFDQVYYFLSMGDSKIAEDILRKKLSPIQFTPEAEVEIVNFELARKLNNSKPDKSRLDKVLSFTKCARTKIGVFAVLEDKVSLYKYLKETLEKDKSSKYLIKRWPVMKPHLSDSMISSLLS